MKSFHPCCHQGLLTAVLAFAVGLVQPGWTQEANLEDSGLKKSLTFLASFDDGFDADFAVGNKKALTSADLSRKKITEGISIDGVQITENGKWGKAIDFAKKTKQVVCFQAAKNFPHSAEPFDASISFWMRTDLAKLPKGFIDPLQITDKKWNDASIFVDFNDKDPRDFRLGVFSDLKFWNPENNKLDELPVEKRPMIDAGQVPFSAKQWTHIGITFQGINHAEKSVCHLFINGKRIGEMNRPQRFTWNPEKAMIMLGIYYTGQIDDFAIFRTNLSEKQIRDIYRSSKSLSSLLNDQ